MSDSPSSRDEVTVRPTRTDDAAAVGTVLHESFVELVAEVGGTVAGYVALSRARRDPLLAEVEGRDAG